MVLYHLPTPFSIYILTLNALKYSAVKKSFKTLLKLWFLNLAKQDIQKYYSSKAGGIQTIKETANDFLLLYWKKEESRQIKYV